MDLLSAILAAMVNGKTPQPPAPVTDTQSALIAQGGDYSSAPAIALWSVATPYGQFACIQRGRNALYGMQATQLEESPQSVRGAIGTTGAAIWCRGETAIIATAGPNASALGDALRRNF